MSLITIILAVVFLEKAETLTFDEMRIPDAQILTGDVCFRHDSMRIYCDSAYFYDQRNSLQAMGHVHMVQGDTIDGRCDWAYYDGEQKVAKMRGHVRLDNNGTILTTDSLNYDRGEELAYYYTGGQIQDSLNVLTSIIGSYHSPTKEASFQYQVHLVNEKFTLDADTLYYNTETKVADFLCPTRIVYDSTTILSSNGWYNTQTEKSALYDRSQIIQNDGKTLTADTIFYDKAIGYGKLIDNLQMVDTAQKMTLFGDIGEAWEENDKGYVTGHAMLEAWGDTAHAYVHGDSIWAEQIACTMMIDSVERDTTCLRVRVYKGVRGWREDGQVVCDSMVWIGKDSTMHMYGNPILWRDRLQVSADTMYLYMKDGKMDRARGVHNGLSVQQCEYDSTYYNQVCGKEWTAYVRDGEVKQVDFNGNAETVFYPDDEGEYVGMNVSQSSYVSVYLEEQHIHHIRFTTKTTGTMYPLDQIPEGKEWLTQYFWADGERPINKDDIFRRVGHTKRPERGAISASDETEEKPRTSRKSKLKKK